jgi:DNA polymerase-3 subunit delta
MPGASTKAYPVFGLVSQDRLLRNDALEGLLQDLAGEAEPLLTTRLDGESAELAEVLDEVRTLSLLGDRRVVIVDDADAFVSANRKALERYCSNPSDSGTLILLCNTLPKSTRLYKNISSVGKTITCQPPKGREVVPWIIRRAQARYSKQLTAQGAQTLREHVGDAPGALDAELGKLAAYVGQRAEITPADIDTLTGHSREEKVFAVTDAMSVGDTATALRQWEQVLVTDRAAPARAIAGLAWGLRRLLEARRDWEEGASVHGLARRMYTDAGVLERRLKRVTVGQLEEQQRDLLAADLAIKTGASTVDVAVEKFIVKHSAAGRT